MKKKPRLVIVPSVSVWESQDSLIFDRKFYDGISLYAQFWPGDITCIIVKKETNFPEFGVISRTQENLPFKVILLDESEKICEDNLLGASIVLASGDSFQHFHVSGLCRDLHIKCVYIIEYITETRYQIVSLNTKNIFLKLRRFFYIWNQERKRLAAFKLSDGLQANGTAAYSEYNQIKNSILYFDTRIYKKNTITDTELELKLNDLNKRKILRLAFSGRLIPMKGADHLVRLAAQLKKRNIHFHLTIYGTGESETEMKEFIYKHQLNNLISMPGSVDFYNKLLPDLKQKIDLFICLHRQSDPSCTYLETLSCGVPIVGYNNKAFVGLLEHSDIGWSARLNDINEITDIIENLDKNRATIAQKSRNSVIFARQHEFETTFQKRVDHLMSLL